MNIEYEYHYCADVRAPRSWHCTDAALCRHVVIAISYHCMRICNV